MIDHTPHAYGCENKGCDRRGYKTTQWLPGFGYVQVWLCLHHMDDQNRQWTLPKRIVDIMNEQPRVDD